MNNRFNQAVLIFAIVIVFAWNYMRYTNTKKVEKYEMDKTQILEHIVSTNEIDSILTMTAAAKLTDDDQTIQSAYDLAESQNREELIELFKYRHDSFYIIGAQTDDVLRHELSHALYGYSVKYKISIDQLIKKYQKDLKPTIRYILDKGYDKTVINDELQAYITDNDDEFIKKHTPKHIVEQMNQLYEYHSKQNV